MKKLVLFIGLAFVNCAAHVWVKDGKDQYDFAADKQFCKMYATQQCTDQTAMRNLTINVDTAKCMKERGWRREKVQ
jgi:hypothetical protein